MQRKRRGKFISFEGGEGVGKTTQIARLAKRFEAQGIEVLVTREPGGTAIANRIRSLLLDPQNHGIVPLAELFLYEASRAQHVQELILPALEKGKIVICDRYTDSSLVYQGNARGIKDVLVANLNKIATSNVLPNVTLILDLNPKIGLARIGKRGILDRIEKEALDFHLRVQKGFRNLAKRDPKRCFLIDASQSRDAIHEDICSVLEKKSLL